MSNLQKSLLKSKLPPMIPRAGKSHPGRQKDYSPAMYSGKLYNKEVCQLSRQKEFILNCRLFSRLR